MIAGRCSETSISTFYCTCPSNWQGIRCETPVSHCENVVCLNQGVCRSSASTYTCQCLSASYSGRYCELKANRLSLHRTLAKSIGFAGICSLIILALFVTIMDLLKYGFGIDPVGDDLKRMQIRKKKAREPIAIRFLYVHVPMKQNLTTSNAVPVG